MYLRFIFRALVWEYTSHVGKYDRHDDRLKLASLAIDIGPMIDRGLDDNCGPMGFFHRQARGRWRQASSVLFTHTPLNS